MKKIEYPAGYVIALNEEQRAKNWPHLIIGENFEFTSPKKKGYNCVGYALGEVNKDIDMLALSKRFDLSPFGLSNEQLDHTINGYIKLITGLYGYEICDTSEAEDGFDKIVLFEGIDEDGDLNFLHMAKQLGNGIWTSKMGTFEDIEHLTPDAVNGYYGKPKVFMKRKKGMNVSLFN